MKNKRKISTFFLAVITAFIVFPQGAMALDKVITLWSVPLHANLYYSDTHVIYSGNWVLPPEYFGAIQLLVGGVVISTINIDSFGATSPVNSSFSFDAGAFTTSTWNSPNRDQQAGNNDASIKVLAKPRCLQEGTCSLCVDNIENNPAGCGLNTVQQYLPRTYIINGATAPVLGLAGISLYGTGEGTTQTGNVNVKNFGIGNLEGTITISGDAEVFSCVQNCTYSNLPLEYALSQGLTGYYTKIAFSPPAGSGGTTYNATFNFSCINCSPPTSMAWKVTAKSVLSDSPPDLKLMRWGGSSEWKTSPISFGTVVIGEAPDEDSVFGFSIYNAGGDVGGGLSGRSTLSPDTGQYLCKWAGCEDNGCADKCDCVDGAVVYENIHPGRFCSTRIRFVPHTAGEDNPVIRLSNTVVPSQFEERGFSALGVDNSSDSVNVDLGESDFGRVYIGHTKNKTFRFSNTGTSNLGPGVFLTSSPFSCVEARDNLGNVVPNCGYNIAPGSFANVTVKFSPTAQQRYLSDVVLSVPPGMITYPITGEGVKMRIFKFLEL